MPPVKPRAVKSLPAVVRSARIVLVEIFPKTSVNIASQVAAV